LTEMMMDQQGMMAGPQDATPAAPKYPRRRHYTPTGGEP
jgi:hypothetical protein